MDLKNLTDQTLLSETIKLRGEEREILNKLLHHLREIERRRLFSSLGYTSLFDYAVRGLKYSEDQAQRRISAMRLLKEIPEIEEKIVTGELSLTNLSIAQSAFRQAPTSREEKVEFLKGLENQSTREAQKIVATKFPQKPIEKTKPINEKQVVWSTTISLKTEEKLKRIKDLLAHKYPNIESDKLLDLLCDLGINEWDLGKQKSTRQTPAAEKRTPSIITKRNVWRKAESKCENCGSQHALQTDHVPPYAQFGLGGEENLRLLCRNCNQRAAIKSYGVERMEMYLNQQSQRRLRF